MIRAVYPWLSALLFLGVVLPAFAQDGQPGGQPGGGGGGGGGSEMLAWSLLVISAIAAALLWRRLTGWVQGHVEPAIDRVRSAADALEGRARPARLQAISATFSGGAFLEAVLGESWVRPGLAYVVASDERDAVERVTADLLNTPGSAVAVSSGRVGIEALGRLLTGSAAHGRLFHTPDDLLDGVAEGLAWDLARVGAPAAFVVDLRGRGGRTAEAAGGVARALGPVLARLGAVAVMVVDSSAFASADARGMVAGSGVAGVRWHVGGRLLDAAPEGATSR